MPAAASRFFDYSEFDGMSNASRTSVKRALRELEQFGVLRVYRHAVGDSPTQYCLTTLSKGGAS